MATLPGQVVTCPASCRGSLANAVPVPPRGDPSARRRPAAPVQSAEDSVAESNGFGPALPQRWPSAAAADSSERWSVAAADLGMPVITHHGALLHPCSGEPAYRPCSCRRASSAWRRLRSNSGAVHLCSAAWIVERNAASAVVASRAPASSRATSPCRVPRIDRAIGVASPARTDETTWPPSRRRASARCGHSVRNGRRHARRARPGPDAAVLRRRILGAQRRRIRIPGVARHDCGRQDHRHGLLAQPAGGGKQRRAAAPGRHSPLRSCTVCRPPFFRRSRGQPATVNVSRDTAPAQRAPARRRSRTAALRPGPPTRPHVRRQPDHLKQRPTATSTRWSGGCGATGCCCRASRCWPSRSPRCARSRRRGCTPRWPTRLGGRTARCLGSWWRCWRCRRAGGCRSWSGCAGRRRARPAPAWPRRWSGWRRSPRSGWAG